MLSAQLLTLLSTSEKMHHCMLRPTFDEKFWPQILTQIHFSSDGLLSLSSSQRVKKVKNCINMMAKKRVKKKLIF